MLETKSYDGISSNHVVVPGWELSTLDSIKGITKIEATIRPVGEKVTILTRTSQVIKPDFLESKKRQIREAGAGDVIQVTERGFEITYPDGKKVVFDFRDYDGELDPLMYKFLPTMEEIEMLTGYFTDSTYVDIGEIAGLKAGYYPIQDGKGQCIGSVSTGGKKQRIRLIVSR